MDIYAEQFVVELMKKTVVLIQIYQNTIPLTIQN